MPASNDPEADRACFLAIMTMDDNGLRQRFKGITPKKRVLELATPAERAAYQELARGFGLKDYSPLLASGRVNKVRLHTPTSLDKKHLRGEPGDFATSLLRHTLFAIYEISRQADAGACTEPGRQWLQKEVPTYWGRPQDHHHPPPLPRPLRANSGDLATRRPRRPSPRRDPGKRPRGVNLLYFIEMGLDGIRSGIISPAAPFS